MSQQTEQQAQLEAIWAYVDAHADDMLEQLKTLVRQPSISAQNVGVAECAELLAGMMRDPARQFVPQALLKTDPTNSLAQIIAWLVARWPWK